ncbi:MAG: hypothetical protein H7221_11010 [Flavobacterium sp.]|nr:hypothetical protein [Flavobacterium sp.]
MQAKHISCDAKIDNVIIDNTAFRLLELALKLENKPPKAASVNKGFAKSRLQ